MKIHRFFCEIKNDKIADDEVLNQIRRVLKLRQDEQIIVCDGAGRETLAEIVDVATGQVRVIEARPNASEPQRKVVLYCAVLKRENFEWAAQKATEVGVAEIVPVITARTVKLNVNVERLQKIVKEAAEQSGRGLVSLVREPVEFTAAVAAATAAPTTNILFDSSGETFQASSFKFQEVNVWIGPEGGWDAKELEQAKSFKFQVLSLGKLTLRAETAAVVASYLATQ